jgi:hypothetical protein
MKFIFIGFTKENIKSDNYKEYYFISIMIL